MNTVINSQVKLLTGAVFLFICASNVVSQAIDINDIGGSLPGLVLNGANEGDMSGDQVAFLGDINNGGIDDILIDTRALLLYVLFGSSDLVGNIALCLIKCANYLYDNR